MGFVMNKRIKLGLQDVIKRGYLTEQNVGITEFLSEHQPFIGVLKHRFEDFIVHEINKNGKLIRLENIDKPEDVTRLIHEEQEQSRKDEKPVLINDLNIGSEFKEIIDKYVENNYQSEHPMIPIDQMDKQQRGQIHLYIKQNYKGLESKTEIVGDKKFIKIVPFKQSNRKNRCPIWPTKKPNYVHFVLYKENLETVHVVNEISRLLKSTTKNFTFAGSKDKRAITTQMFSAFKTNPLKIWRAVNEFNQRSRNQVCIHVGHFEYQTEPLRLGDLSGNHFDIVLRNVRLVKNLDRTEELSAEEKQKTISEIENALNSIRSKGFINYFGMQRFGSHRIDSHKLGILILRKEFKKLVEEILVEKPIDIRPYKNPKEISFNEAIRLWRETRDASLAYKKLNYKYTIEGSLLRALTKVDENDYHGALCIGMTRNSRLLYLHAYQSYLWNCIASFRIREYGLKVVEGDLVFVGPDFVDDEVMDGECLDNENDNFDEINEKSDNSNIKCNIPSDQIVLVTQANLDRFTIFDVVLPIIGSLSKFPKNRTEDFINKILREDNVTLDQFGALGKQWCVNGSYRKLLAKPSQFEWEWINYEDENKPLILSDLDHIHQKKQIIINENINAKLALKINVTLPTSCYATIFLREITKVSSLSLENKPWQQGQQLQPELKDHSKHIDNNENE